MESDSVMADRLPSVLLRHTQDGDVHFDWLLGVPGMGKSERLWTWRIAVPSCDWVKGQSYEMQRIFDHRAQYLTYEGEISGNRGYVERVDEGTHHPVVWSGEKITTRMELRHFKGIAIMECLNEDQWQVTFKASGSR